MLTNKKSDITLASSEFLSQLMLISTDIVWKDQTEAYKYEDPAESIMTEIFVAASKGMLTFDTIFQLTPTVLAAAGLDPMAVNAAMDDKRTVPQSLRPLVTSLFVKELLMKDANTGKYVNYVEYNDYYRKLFGLPSIHEEPKEFVYNTKYEDISQTIPVHKLSLPDRYILESRGYLKELMAQHPTKKYIKHLASQCIDPYLARTTEKFGILYIKPASSTKLSDDFKDMYNDCRQNMIRVYYSDAFRKDNDLYDGFIAMCILFMTIQLMHYKYLDADVDRDFYDLESIRYIYDAYGVPFYKTIPLEYHRRVVKSINRLLSYKGSTRVFYELFDLFDYGSMDVFSYYLLKTHRFDAEGNPLFVFDEDGKPDNRAMYDIKFGKVRLYDDPPLELSDPANHVDYVTMTANDPYWISDKELLDKLYDDMDFNYRESKYIGIQTIFDMMQIVYEACYFFKMITDKKIDLSGITLTFNPLNKNIGIFTIVIYISALVCKKYGYEGNISSEYPFVSKILGFNFKEDLNVIRENIAKNKYLSQDTYLDNILISMNVNSIQSIDDTFKKITDLQKYFADKMATVKTRDEYFAYADLQKVLMISDIVESSYKKKNGTLAASFADLLSDLDPELYIRLLAEDIPPVDELDLLLVLLKKAIASLKFIEYSDGVDISAMIEHLFKLLNFFKSAKAELTGYNIVYTISSRGLNMMRFLEEIRKIENTNFQIHDKFNVLTDVLGIFYDTMHFSDKFEWITDELEYDTTDVFLHDRINILKDMLMIITNVFETSVDAVAFRDIMNIAYTRQFLKSRLPLDDSVILGNEWVDWISQASTIKDRFIEISDAIAKSIQSFHVESVIPFSVGIEKIHNAMILVHDSDNLVIVLDNIFNIKSKDIVRSNLTLEARIIASEILGLLNSQLLLDDSVNKVLEETYDYYSSLLMLDTIREECLVTLNDLLTQEDKLIVPDDNIIITSRENIRDRLEKLRDDIHRSERLEYLLDKESLVLADTTIAKMCEILRTPVQAILDFEDTVRSMSDSTIYDKELFTTLVQYILDRSHVLTNLLMDDSLLDTSTQIEKHLQIFKDIFRTISKEVIADLLGIKDRIMNISLIADDIHYYENTIVRSINAFVDNIHIFGISSSISDRTLYDGLVDVLQMTESTHLIDDRSGVVLREDDVRQINSATIEMSRLAFHELIGNIVDKYLLTDKLILEDSAMCNISAYVLVLFKMIDTIATHRTETIYETFPIAVKLLGVNFTDSIISDKKTTIVDNIRTLDGQINRNLFTDVAASIVTMNTKYSAVERFSADSKFIDIAIQFGCINRIFEYNTVADPLEMLILISSIIDGTVVKDHIDFIARLKARTINYLDTMMRMTDVISSDTVSAIHDLLLISSKLLTSTLSDSISKAVNVISDRSMTMVGKLNYFRLRDMIPDNIEISINVDRSIDLCILDVLQDTNLINDILWKIKNTEIRKSATSLIDFVRIIQDKTKPLDALNISDEILYSSRESLESMLHMPDTIFIKNRSLIRDLFIMADKIINNMLGDDISLDDIGTIRDRIGSLDSNILKMHVLYFIRTNLRMVDKLDARPALITNAPNNTIMELATSVLLKVPHINTRSDLVGETMLKLCILSSTGISHLRIADILFEISRIKLLRNHGEVLTFLSNINLCVKNNGNNDIMLIVDKVIPMKVITYPED